MMQFTKFGQRDQGLHPQTLNSLVRAVKAGRHPVSSGAISFVSFFLSGCCTRPLGDALIAKGVKCVVCWSTCVADEPARALSVAFFKAVQQMINQRFPIDYHAVFERAKATVTSIMRPGTTAGGQSGDVPKYEFRAPQLVMQASGQVVDVSVSSATYKPKPWAAGLPCILP